MENKKVAVIISPNWRDYAKKYLNDCVEGLRKQDYSGEMKIYITDNETSEESFKYLNENAPELEIIRNTKNDGFAKGNNDAIKLALKENFDYIILFNLDTVAKPNCISELVKVAESDPKIGAIQARIMLFDRKDVINSIGNVTHFLGFGYCLGYREKMSNAKCQMSNVAYPSGAGVLFKAEVLKKIGLFDEKFWMYNEDQDLGWRTWLASYKCVLAPEAVLYHKYEFSKSIKQYYWMDRNRIIAMLKNYRLATLILVFPAFIIMEGGMVLFSLNQGWLKDKFRVWGFFLNPLNWAYLKEARRESQEIRQVGDKEIVGLFSGEIWYQEIGDWKLKLANKVFKAYWGIVKKMIIW